MTENQGTSSSIAVKRKRLSSSLVPSITIPLDQVIKFYDVIKPLFPEIEALMEIVKETQLKMEKVEEEYNIKKKKNDDFKELAQKKIKECEEKEEKLKNEILAIAKRIREFMDNKETYKAGRSVDS